MSGYRLPRGGSVDRDSSLPFTFNGRQLQGLPGDTLASALIANGIRVTGRSFKYHRPRGIYSAGEEEPNAFVSLAVAGGQVPNYRATCVSLQAGMAARSQPGWPTVNFHLGRIFGRLALTTRRSSGPAGRVGKE